MSKKNSGITLIALIITIIVMLILVAVTISMAVNGGLFGYAGNAVKETEQAKQKELDWQNVDGMTTDQLIAKYTTDSERDLEMLRRVLPYAYGIKDPNNMTAEEEEMYTTLMDDFNNGDLVQFGTGLVFVIKYHEVYYKVVIEVIDENEELADLTVDYYTLNEKEELLIEIATAYQRGDVQEIDNFLIYNNSFYFLIPSEDTFFGAEYQCLGSINEVAIVKYRNTDDYIVIRPTLNQTWNMWAGTAGDDLTVKDTTLKQIINANNTTNWEISDDINNTKINNYNTNIVVGHIYRIYPTSDMN